MTARAPGIVAAMRGSAEFDLIRRIAEQLGPRAQGLGDDAAVLSLPHGDQCVVSVDASVEGVHFRREWLSAREIGHRAAAAAMSDLAAMGAAPRALLLALALPERWRGAVLELTEGVGALAASVGAVVVGGNLTAATELSLTITVIGSARTPLRRTGLVPGDALFVTGQLGGPATALEALVGDAVPPAAARARFAAPQPRVHEARWLAAHGASAAIDISDGLLADAAHLAAASGVRLVIDAGAIPLLEGVSATVAATSGEEYELLVGMRTPPDADEFTRRFGLALTRVGQVTDGPAGVVADGLARVANTPGHDHFSG